MGMFGGGAPASSAPAPVSNNNSMGGMDFDIFGGGGTAVPAPASLDPFAMGQSSAEGSAGMSGQAKQKLAQFQLAGEETKLASNSTVAVSTSTYVGPTSTCVAVFVTNKSGGPLQNVRLMLQQAAWFNFQFDGDAAQRQSQNGQALVGIGSLAPGATSTQLVLIQCTQVVQNTQIPAQLSWQGSQPQNLSINISLVDLLRPLTINTGAFGNLWKQLPGGAQVKFALRSSCTSPPDFMARMKDKMHIHPVQTIKAENICAGTLVSAQQQSSLLCLVHGKMSAEGILVLVRSAHPAFSQALQRELQAVLQ